LPCRTFPDTGPKPCVQFVGCRRMLNESSICSTSFRFRAEPIEYATNGEVMFARWIARGTRPQGFFEAVGVDRIIASQRPRQRKPDSIGSPGYRGLRRACG